MFLNYFQNTLTHVHYLQHIFNILLYSICLQKEINLNNNNNNYRFNLSAPETCLQNQEIDFNKKYKKHYKHRNSIDWKVVKNYFHDLKEYFFEYRLHSSSNPIKNSINCPLMEKSSSRVLTSIALEMANLYPEETCMFMECTDKIEEKNRMKVARKIAKNSKPILSKHIQSFSLSEHNSFEIAKKCLTYKETLIDILVDSHANFNLSKDSMYFYKLLHFIYSKWEKPDSTFLTQLNIRDYLLINPNKNFRYTYNNNQYSPLKTILSPLTEDLNNDHSQYTHFFSILILLICYDHSDKFHQDLPFAIEFLKNMESLETKEEKTEFLMTFLEYYYLSKPPLNNGDNIDLIKEDQMGCFTECPSRISANSLMRLIAFLDNEYFIVKNLVLMDKKEVDINQYLLNLLNTKVLKDKEKIDFIKRLTSISSYKATKALINLNVIINLRKNKITEDELSSVSALQDSASATLFNYLRDKSISKKNKQEHCVPFIKDLTHIRSN